MSTYTRILYHIVFATKFRQKTLTADNRVELFKYIHGILEKKKCFSYQINGVEDHIHILVDIHPTVAVSSLVKDIKLASTCYIKEKKLFKNFGGWQEGFGAFTYSINEKERLINYIKNQEEHHSNKLFRDEYIDILNDFEIEYDERYLP